MTDQFKPCLEQIADTVCDILYGGEGAWLDRPSNEICKDLREAWNTRHIPEGFVLVPIEMEMELGFRAVRHTNDIYDLTDIMKVYSAIVKAVGDQDD